MSSWCIFTYIIVGLSMSSCIVHEVDEDDVVQNFQDIYQVLYFLFTYTVV